MKRYYLIFFISLANIISPIVVGAINDINKPKNYDLWSTLPSEQLINMGDHFHALEKDDSAFLCCNIVANRYYTNGGSDKESQIMAARAMNNLGILYTYNFVDYEKALKYLLQAEKIAKKNGALTVLSAIYVNLSNLYLIDCSYSSDGKLNEKVIEYHEKAFESALKANKPKIILNAVFNLAHIADDMNYGDALRTTIEKFLHYPIPDSIKESECVKYYCMAVNEHAKGNDLLAISLCDKALDVMYENGIQDDVKKYNILLSKSNFLFNQNQSQQALDILNNCILFGDSIGDHHLLHVSYDALSRYHYEKNDSVLGNKYELLALREKEIVFNKNKLLDDEKVDFIFRIDNINAEIINLKIRQKMTKIFAWGSAAITLIILFMLYLLWRKYGQVQEKNRKLYENNLILLESEDQRRKLMLKDGHVMKYRTHQMNEAEQSDLLQRILYIMETSDEVFEESFSLDRLTELVSAGSRNYVSQVLNEHYKRSFPAVLNEYRIREICRRLNDREHFGHLTNEGIAQSVGFKSYPNFVSNFKKITGLTPSAYRKQAEANS
ncbi:MAG: AraC family transcriptional regulator [Muribaculaceae bacterium]|nr:AraC family transcriptional regulator [Muribaculaceae bacterium]